MFKHTTLCDKCVFSVVNISQPRRSIELKFSKVCYLMHINAEIHQVRRLVFENYQQCPVSLTARPVCNGPQITSWCKTSSKVVFRFFLRGVFSKLRRKKPSPKHKQTNIQHTTHQKQTDKQTNTTTKTSQAQHNKQSNKCLRVQLVDLIKAVSRWNHSEQLMY